MKRKQIDEVLEEIQKNAPKKLKEALLDELKKTPTVEFVIDKALESDTISEEKKARLLQIKKTGAFSGTEFVVNKDIQKKYDAYLEKEIGKAIDEGRLPTKERLAKLPFIKKLNKKYEDKENNDRGSNSSSKRGRSGTRD